jgi:DNA-binding Lrp family transcriptional regulator
MDLGLTAEFERQIQLTPEVRTCHMVTGSYSYIMVMQLADIADYNTYLRERLSKLPGVASIQTQVVIDTIKDNIQFPQ